MGAQVLTAEKRTETGKNAARRLRGRGFIPAVLTAHGKTESLQLGEKDFSKLFKGGISESVIFELNIEGGDSTLAFVKDFQIDPVTDGIVHLDLYKITKGEKIHTSLPLEITGTPKGAKLGGLLEIYERHISVECLPMDLPEKYVVDVSDLGLDENIHAKDLNLGDKIKLLSSPDTVIAVIHPPKKAEDADSSEGGSADNTGE